MADDAAPARPPVSAAELQTRLRALAAKIGAPDDLLPTYAISCDWGRPHLEITPPGYSYVVVERGMELERTRYAGADELLYRAFLDATQSMASGWAARHRVEGEEFRHTMFRRQAELMNVLSPEWGDRARVRAEGYMGHPI